MLLLLVGPDVYAQETALDLQRFSLSRADVPGVARQVQPGPPAVLRVQTPFPRGTTAPSLSLIYTPVAVQARDRLTIRLRGRGDAAQRLRLFLTAGRPPYAPIAPPRDLLLTEKWKNFSFVCRVNQTDEAAVLRLDFEAAKPSFEIADVSLEPTPVDASQLDAAEWQLQVQPDCVAALEAAPEVTEGYRVVIGKIPDKSEPWKVQLLQANLSIEKGRHYLVSFQARADQPRMVACAVASSEPPFETLGLYQDVPLDRTFSPVGLRFEATKTTKSAQFRLNIGNSAIPVEVAHFRLVPLPTLAEDEFDPGRWRLTTKGEGNRARLSFNPEAPNVLQVQILEADPTRVAWHIGMTYSGLSVRAGHHYRLTFLGRAEKTRAAVLSMVAAEPPYSNLGLFSMVTFHKDWSTFEHQFTATADAPGANLRLDVGNSRAAIELAEMKWSEMPMEESTVQEEDRRSAWVSAAGALSVGVIFAALARWHGRHRRPLVTEDGAEEPRRRSGIFPLRPNIPGPKLEQTGV